MTKKRYYYIIKSKYMLWFCDYIYREDKKG